MNGLRQFIFCLAPMVVISVSAQNPPLPAAKKNSPWPVNHISKTTQTASPVDFFRQLLTLSPEECAAALTNRPPAARERILAKLREYEVLDPDERELRLRATELRWYLMPLLRMPPAQRPAQLAKVPDNLRELVKSRLQEWSILPPPLQEEFLANDPALHYFALVDTTNQPAITAQQQKMADQFSRFFELTPDEKEQTLNTLSDAERVQMQKTLRSFENLPPQQRLTCVRNYAKFAGMSGAERAEFLKNAASWSKMSPNERQAWRDLVENVPDWPPMPPDMIQPAQPLPRPNVATNAN